MKGLAEEVLDGIAVSDDSVEKLEPLMSVQKNEVASEELSPEAARDLYGRRLSPRAIPSASNTQDGLEQTHSAAKDTATLHGGDGKKVSLAESNWVHRKSPWTSRHPVARLHHTAESWG